ncbi:MAG: efflux RND transporter periplasmic adaptor subunit [Planctomycetota bacterium]
MSTNEKRTAEHPPGAPRPERDSTGSETGATRTLRKPAIIIGALLLLLLAGSFRLLAAGGENASGDTVPTTAVRRGQLVVSVTEGGTLNALESLEVKSEVEGNNQILEIVDEGTVITREDVENGKVLVRLDASDLEDREADREISFQTAEASYVQAKENYEIQVKQNTSNVNSARLEVKFARMELERYLGSELAARLLAEEEQEDFDFALLQGMAQQLVENILGSEATRAALREVYQENLPQGGLQLGGIAQQRLRDLSAELQLAVQEMERAEDTLIWTQRLAERDYVSGNQLTADRLSANRAEVRVESTQEELHLFIRYTLPKEAEQRWSDYEEALLSLDRVEARARSELAQAEANLNSRQRTYELEQERLEKTREMIEKSTIRATEPGVVVYASTTDPRRYRNNPIEEGTSVRQNETIISVPNLETLAARVNVHETDISKIQRGQKARISVEAQEGTQFPGEVARISPMASSEHRWLNPDVMVYETDVRLTEVPEGLTPGMSATAEIIIAELEAALYVPLQAVNTYRGQRVCWVKTPDGPRRRNIETGYFTDKYVEIRDGLREGELVYLAPPEELQEELEEIQALVPEKAEEELPAEEQEAEQPEAEEQDDSEVDVQELLSRMEGMSRDERREFIQNLSDQERSRLMEQWQRPGGGPRPGGGQGGPRRQPD